MENQDKPAIHLKAFYVILTVSIIYLSTSKGESNQESWISFLSQYDKAMHFLMYATHCFFSYLIVRKMTMALVLSFTLSFLMELIQYFLPYRSFELYDLLANFSGCVFALVIHKIWISRNSH